MEASSKNNKKRGGGTSRGEEGGGKWLARIGILRIICGGTVDSSRPFKLRWNRESSESQMRKGEGGLGIFPPSSSKGRDQER